MKKGQRERGKEENGEKGQVGKEKLERGKRGLANFQITVVMLCAILFDPALISFVFISIARFPLFISIACLGPRGPLGWWTQIPSTLPITS